LARASRALATPPAFSAWPAKAADQLAAGLAAFGERLQRAAVYYLPFGWDFLGPLPISAPSIFGRAVVMARGRSEECAVCTADAAQGIWLQYHAADAEHGEPHPYELIVWGDEWLALARDTVPFALAAREP
jgi:hypothetical protein